MDTNVLLVVDSADPGDPTMGDPSSSLHKPVEPVAVTLRVGEQVTLRPILAISRYIHMGRVVSKY